MLQSVKFSRQNFVFTIVFKWVVAEIVLVMLKNVKSNISINAKKMMFEIRLPIVQVLRKLSESYPKAN